MFVAVKTELPSVVAPRLVRVAARALVEKPTELVKVTLVAATMLPFVVL